MIDSTYSVSSFVGLVSSKRRWQRELGAYSCGDAEVQADGLRVADVQVAVRLRREARDHPAAVLSCADIGGDDLADEIEAGCCGGGSDMGGGGKGKPQTANYKSQDEPP